MHAASSLEVRESALRPQIGCAAVESIDRARWLARGLTRLGINSTDLLVLAFCISHQTEASIAHNAAGMIDVKTTVCDHLSAPPQPSFPAGRRFVVACEDSAIEWQNRKLTGLLIADVPCCYWWKGMEAREQSLEIIERDARRELVAHARL